MTDIDLTQVNPKRLYFPNQPIQWHLGSTSRDRCPRCGGPLWYVGAKSRYCGTSGDPGNPCPAGTTWMRPLAPDDFVAAMLAQGEVVRMRRPGRKGGNYRPLTEPDR